MAQSLDSVYRCWPKGGLGGTTCSWKVPAGLMENSDTV